MQHPSKTLGLILSSRKVWVALAAVASCIVVVVGADPAKWTPLIAAIVTLSSVVVAATAYEDAADKGNPGSAAYDAGGDPVLNTPPSPDAAPQGEIVHSYRVPSVTAAQAKAASTNLLLIGVALAFVLAGLGCKAPSAPATQPSTQPALTQPSTQPVTIPLPIPISLPTAAQIQTTLSNLQSLVEFYQQLLSAACPFLPVADCAAGQSAGQIAAAAITALQSTTSGALPSAIPSIAAQVKQIEADVASLTNHPAVTKAKAAVKLAPATQPG